MQTKLDKHSSECGFEANFSSSHDDVAKMNVSNIELLVRSFWKLRFLVALRWEIPAVR